MIEIKNISKFYGNHVALKNISTCIKPNSIVGLLGQNGAGKTTLLDILCGCKKADEGHIYIQNFEVNTAPLDYKRCIGYMPELPPVYTEMTVVEFLKFVAQLKQIQSKDIKAHIEDILNKTGLAQVSSRLIANLSKGYRQRVGLAQALVGNADILVLDEPTVGLDPKQTHELLNLIKKLSKSHTIILSSHRLYDIQDICTDYIILHKGEIKHTGCLAENQKEVDLELCIASKDENHVQELKNLTKVQKIIKIKSFCLDDTPCMLYHLKCLKPTPETEILCLLQQHGTTVLGLKRFAQNIETIFLDVTKE